MVERALSRVVEKSISKVLGVSVFWKNDGGISYQLAMVEKDKSNELKMTFCKDYETFEDLTQWIREHHPKLPVVLGMDGRSVLVRKLDDKTSYGGRNEIVDKVIPESDPQDFIINVAQTERDLIVSMIRKGVLSQYVTEWRDAGMMLAAVYVGLPAYLQLTKTLNEEGPSVFGHYELTFDQDGQLVDLKRSGLAEDSYFSQEIKHRQLAVFGFVTRFFMINSTDFYQELPPEIREPIRDFKYKVLFGYTSKAAIGAAFVLFLINALLFVTFNEENNQLKEQSADTQLLLKTLETKQKEYERKKSVIDKLNYQNSNFAYFSDVIGGIVPGGILLNRLNFNPISKNKRKKDSPFEEGKVIISGESSNAQVFGKFIENIQNLDMAESMEQQDYAFSAKKKKGVFEIKIAYKLEE